MFISSGLNGYVNGNGAKPESEDRSQFLCEHNQLKIAPWPRDTNITCLPMPDAIASGDLPSLGIEAGKIRLVPKAKYQPNFVFLPENVDLTVTITRSAAAVGDKQSKSKPKTSDVSLPWAEVTLQFATPVCAVCTQAKIQQDHAAERNYADGHITIVPLVGKLLDSVTQKPTEESHIVDMDETTDASVPTVIRTSTAPAAATLTTSSSSSSSSNAVLTRPTRTRMANRMTAVSLTVCHTDDIYTVKIKMMQRLDFIKAISQVQLYYDQQLLSDLTKTLADCNVPNGATLHFHFDATVVAQDDDLMMVSNAPERGFEESALYA
jgi:hypothetical protein